MEWDFYLHLNLLIFFIFFWNLCEHAYLFLILYSALANAANLSVQVNGIPMLNGSNFKIWKENVEIILGCMELDLTLRVERPTSTPENLNEANIEKWERSNRLSLMLMKRSIPKAFRGSINESVNATKFLLDIEQVFTKNEKTETSTLLHKRGEHKGVHNGNV